MTNVQLENMQNVDIFPVEKRNQTENELICNGIDCGEGGCMVDQNTKEATCFCTDGVGLSPMNPETKTCNFTIANPIDPNSKVDQAMPPMVQPETVNPVLPQSTESQIDTMKIALPVAAASVLLISLVSLLLYLRYRRIARSRTPKTDTPVSWLQDRVMLLENLTVLSKNPSYYSTDLETATNLSSLQHKQIPHEQLKLYDVIGEGAFGKVYKGEVSWSEDNVEPVAVKVLKEDVSMETRHDFQREVDIMSSFQHDNILRLVGVVAIVGHSPYMIFEYMEHGDLTEVLRSNDPSSVKVSAVELKLRNLVDVATQIANGMVYLSSQHFVHRDLATRNCLVGGNIIVKISDFGMSRDIYTCDYYRVSIRGSRLLPVRWMSPESVKYGQFTLESDIWSYGVLLWEIFSYGKQPYYGHANEEVIRFIEDGILLQRPPTCPDTIYHLMLGCWRRQPKERFNFERIHHHLVEYCTKVLKCYAERAHVHNVETA